MTIKNKEFWEVAHKDNNQYWLTNSNPWHVYDLHNLTMDLTRSKYNVLEIGVGTGKSIMILSELHNVYAVDIAYKALERVELFVTAIQTYDIAKWPKNKIDIALCHLVFQHCDDDSFGFLIQQVLESLTCNGYFTFQSADAEESKLNKNYNEFIRRGLIFFRSKDKVISIVNKLGGEVVSVSDDILHPNECDIVWNVFRIVKNSRLYGK